MRDLHDFDARMERSRRRFDVIWRLTMTLIILAWIGIGIAGVWLLLHPETIGSWVGRLISALGGAGHG
jgi:NhaP-type Na+/H+ or K+/H+ antiporter